MNVPKRPKWAGAIALAAALACAMAPTAMVRAAASSAATGLSPDGRPTLLLQPPQGALWLVQHAVGLADHRPESLALKFGHWITRAHSDQERRNALPAVWRSTEADRGFAKALLMQLSHVAANWPWRALIVSTSGPESDRQLETLEDQDVVLAVVHDELADLGGKVEFHVTLELTTLRGVATAHESHSLARVEYFAPVLSADTAHPRRAQGLFAQDGVLDEQVSTAATDLSQFLATFVARVSVPESLHPHNPTLADLGAHPGCGECRPSDQVVYVQPDRIWVRVGRLGGSILALPRQLAPPSLRTK